MENFTFYSPTFFVFGKETENQAGTYVKRFGGTKVLIHFGGKSAKSSGLLDRVEKSLAAENIPYVSEPWRCKAESPELPYFDWYAEKLCRAWRKRRRYSEACECFVPWRRPAGKYLWFCYA